MLPKMFASDFRDNVHRYPTLIDPNGNQFEVLVEKINGNIYFTYGWPTLRDFYNIKYGTWVILL